MDHPPKSCFWIGSGIKASGVSKLDDGAVVSAVGAKVELPLNRIPGLGRNQRRLLLSEHGREHNKIINYTYKSVDPSTSYI
jgi:hypothetical protein